MLNALLTEIARLLFSQNALLVQETRPLSFLVIQQIDQNNKDLPIGSLKLRQTKS
jgi:hypothetical protein